MRQFFKGVKGGGGVALLTSAPIYSNLLEFVYIGGMLAHIYILNFLVWAFSIKSGYTDSFSCRIIL